MSDQDRYTDYDNFAWLYNHYWSERLIDQIFGAIQDHLLNKLSPRSHILDVCCGNGHLARKMADSGFQVTGIDGSEPMLRHARENAPGCDFHVCDARGIRFESAFDAVTSTCDSLNHVMSMAELRDVFARVHAALRPGGIFLFDLNTEKGYRDYWTGETGGKTADDHAFVLRLSYDEEVKQGTFAVTLFRLVDGLWQRSDIRLTQQYYPPEEAREELLRSGFADIELYDVEKDLGVDGTGRVMFVARSA
jgi:SAM-dependent methyltransferase